MQLPPRLFRSLCFVPGNNTRFLEKAKEIKADIVCLDLEDSVPAEQKDDARQLVKQSLRDRKSFAAQAVCVRTNSPSSGMIPSDLGAVMRKGIDGIVIPKLGNNADLRRITWNMEEIEQQRRLGPVGIIPSIESAEGVVNAYSIASSGGGSVHSRIECVVFGVFDLLADMGIEYSAGSDAARYARARVALDARGAGVPAIDGIWQDLNDEQGLVQDCLLGRSLGYAGKCVIHPGQIDAVHRAFYPTSSEVSWGSKSRAGIHRVTQSRNRRHYSRGQDDRRGPLQAGSCGTGACKGCKVMIILRAKGVCVGRHAL